MQIQWVSPPGSLLLILTLPLYGTGTFTSFVPMAHLAQIDKVIIFDNTLFRSFLIILLSHFTDICVNYNKIIFRSHKFSIKQCWINLHQNEKTMFCHCLSPSLDSEVLKSWSFKLSSPISSALFCLCCRWWSMRVNQRLTTSDAIVDAINVVARGVPAFPECWM